MAMEYYFSLKMSAHEYLPYYQGRIQNIVVTTTTGKTVQFPAMHLRSFITSGGVSGFFCLITENNKFLKLNKIS